MKLLRPKLDQGPFFFFLLRVCCGSWQLLVGVAVQCKKGAVARSDTFLLCAARL